MQRAEHTPSVYISKFDDWLLKCGQLLEGEVLWTHDGRGLHYSDAQAALDAQYGRARFQAGNHGKALFVRCVRLPPKEARDAN